VTSHDDFEALAKRLSAAGAKVTAPAVLVGRSGARHEFALAVQPQKGGPRVVVDTALSLKSVEDIQVLSFYAKVFDLSPEHALLCVSPHLGPSGKELAREYNISVLENEVPKMLVPMAAKYIEDVLKEKTAK
jgi:hypothetical protein